MKGVSRLMVVALIVAFVSGFVVSTGTSVLGSQSERSGKHEDKVYGTVEKIPDGSVGTWVVKGREIQVTKDTIIKEEHGKAVVGAYVEVEGTQSGKTFTAYKIEVKRAK